MHWFNEPSSWRLEDSALRVYSDPKTDFWRKTEDDGIRDNGHFYYETVSGNFTVDVKITGQYQELYDQAGLMIRLDELIWLKCGIEYVHEQQYASAVVTRDFSDWSIVPLEKPSAIWLRCSRDFRTFTISYSLDGDNYEMIRQCFLTEERELKVGMMQASPKGNGFEVLFEDYSLKNT